MTGDGMCGVFIPDRVLVSWWRSQWKAGDRKWAGRCTTGCGRGQVYVHLATSDRADGPSSSALKNTKDT